MILLGLVLLLVESTAATTIKAEPLVKQAQVAVLPCEWNAGKPAIYFDLNATKWRTEHQTSCYSNEQDVLDICIKVYRKFGLDVKNVLQEAKAVKFSNWCIRESKNCEGQSGIEYMQPWRCLYGAFQSDALLVPEGCNFAHLHDEARCTRPESWQASASKDCGDRHMTLYSYGMLQPCGIDLFTGIEFVCCPPSTKADPINDKISGEAITTGKDDDDDDDDDEDAVDDEDEDEDETDEDEDEAVDNAPTEDDLEAEDEDEVGADEHGRFKTEFDRMIKNHQQKTSGMMSEWNAARERVQAMRDRGDQKGADELNRQITEMFQRRYQTLEEEGRREKQQLQDLHQQRVEAKLIKSKKDAMDQLTAVLRQQTPTAHDLLKAMKHYIRAEEKDRMHLVNHYTHLAAKDAEAGKRQRPQIVERLQWTKQRLQQALDMIQRFPSISQKIQPEIDELLATYHAIEVEAEKIVNENERENEKKKQETLPEEPNAINPVAAKQDSPKMVVDTVGQDNLEDMDNMDEEDEDEIIEETPELPEIPASDNSIVPDKFVKKLLSNKDPAHAMDGSVGVEQKKDMVSLMPAKKSPNLIWPFVGAGVAVLLIALTLIVVRHRRAVVYDPVSKVEEVNAEVSPEERHVTNMQVNGYENPTYRFFEAPKPLNA